MTTPRTPLPQAAVQEIDQALMALASASTKLEPLMDHDDLSVSARTSRAVAEINRAIVQLNNAKATAKNSKVSR